MSVVLKEKAKKIDDRVFQLTGQLLGNISEEDKKVYIEELKLFQEIAKLWALSETIYIPDNRVYEKLSQITDKILPIKGENESFWAASYRDEVNTLLQIVKVWEGAPVINQNADFIPDDGSAEIILAEKALKLKDNFYLFIQEFWSTIIMNDPVWNWHIEYICNELQVIGKYLIEGKNAPYNLVINIPPATSKSTIVSVMFNAWLWANKPSLRVISSSHTSELSVRDAVLTRDIVISPKYRQLFPDVQLRSDSAAKTFYKNTQGGFRYTTSTSSTPTGQHADVRLIDDPLGKMQSKSEADRTAAIEHIKALSTRVVSPEKFTPTILVMQRLHPDDPTEYFLGLNLNTKHICLPAQISDLVSPKELRVKYIDGLLDPIRLSRDVLETRKKELGTDGYGGEYEQNPQIAAGLILSQDEMLLFNPKSFIPSAGDYRIMTVDPADRGDNYAVSVDIIHDGFMDVYDFICNSNGLEVNIPETVQIVTLFKPNIIIIEGNGGWIHTAYVLREQIWKCSPNTKVVIKVSTINKASRIEAQAYYLRNYVRFRNDWREDEDYAQAIRVITSYQQGAINKKDDAIDTLCEAIIFARDNNLL